MHYRVDVMMCERGTRGKIWANDLDRFNYSKVRIT